jgi:hypothetical protein
MLKSNTSVVLRSNVKRTFYLKWEWNQFTTTVVMDAIVQTTESCLLKMSSSPHLFLHLRTFSAGMIHVWIIKRDTIQTKVQSPVIAGPKTSLSK